jgi:transposase-like protein
MRVNYSRCPNSECPYHEAPPHQWYWRKGSFKTKWNQKWVSRFQCKECKTTFSPHTFHERRGQRKPQLNEPIRKLLADGMSIRAIARTTGAARSTVLRKLRFLGKLSEKVCAEQRKLPSSKTSYVQFDEMETFHKTRCLPLTLAIAVRPKTGEIISIQVGTKPSPSDSLRKLAERKYGPRESRKEVAGPRVIS